MTYQVDPSAFETVVANLELRLHEAHKREQLLIHERDALVGRPQAKIWPVQVRCDGKGCRAVVAFDPEPEEARLASALLALGWSGHLCSRCRR